MKSLPPVSSLWFSLRAKSLQWLRQASQGTWALRAPVPIPVRIDAARRAQLLRTRRYRD